MTELIEPTFIFRHLLPALDDEQETEGLIQELEDALAGGTEWCHNRIQFLTQSDPNARDVALDCHEAGVYRISIQKMEQIAKLGLVRAWQEGEITPLEIGALADDIASLQRFNHVLFEAGAREQRAHCWDNTFNLPANLPPIHADLEKIYLEEKKRQENEGS